MGIKSVIFQQLSRNHIGKKCVEERDPYKVRELDGVNTQACEQLFRDVNKHSNCQAMSEANFFMFWLYIMDLHNLEIAGLSRVEPDPREEYRSSVIKVNNIDLSTMNTEDAGTAKEDNRMLSCPVQEDPTRLGMRLLNPTIKTKNIELTAKQDVRAANQEGNMADAQAEKLEESSNMATVTQMLSTLKVTVFKCHICGQSFKREGNFKNHLLRHDDGNNGPSSETDFSCKICSQPFGGKLSLQRHVKVM